MGGEVSAGSTPTPATVKEFVGEENAKKALHACGELLKDVRPEMVPAKILDENVDVPTVKKFFLLMNGI